ncbi:MAG: O-methyltransferase [Lachnospiraceae bacterium]|nr:O-methyltransferase [Lachnospiraceae bacterium]
MIIDERMASFLNSFDTGLPSYLEELETKAIKDKVPIIRTDTIALLKLIMTAHKPHKILEVGCAVGFSALLMREYAPSDVTITTIEKFEKRIVEAKENFEKYDKNKQITLLEGDATEILASLDDEYDLIFMDAAKGQYPNFFPDCMRLLKKGGILISDNVLQDGEVLESRYAVTRRNRTIHTRMRDYLYELTHNDELTSTILPVGDGVTISVKR